MPNNAEKNKQAIDNFFKTFSFKDEAAAVNFFDKLKPEDRGKRYARNDIAVSFGKLFRLRLGGKYPVKLINISSSGALITTRLQFDLQKELSLIFKFNSGKKFKIKGMVVNKRTSPTELNYYGIQFDHHHDELNDYLENTKIVIGSS